MLTLTPIAAFAATVTIARLSGNDKSPFLVLAALGLLALLLLGALAACGRGGVRAARPLAVGAALPLLYAALVLLLARWQLVDPLNWLGFR